eukprot:3094353-Amphidinium_carterae.1
MTRTRALGLPAHVKASIVKSLFSVGSYGAEVGGMSDQHMKDLRASARGAVGKGAVWQRRVAGKVIWPLSGREHCAEAEVVVPFVT